MDLLVSSYPSTFQLLFSLYFRLLFFPHLKSCQRHAAVTFIRLTTYHPPGNGKTISIKATMHALSHLPTPIPTLYVRSLSSYAGPEYSISSIFQKARQYAPCYLVFEDLDSIVTDRVRSYFLNEVDGLESNDGILMIGSTNHLERLDPGISKRPSRFDRKYLFPDPDEDQRVQYCAFWRRKLEGTGEVEFPEVLERAIAGITNGFSFAYIQEAFVASLLAIAASDEHDEEEDDEKENDKRQLSVKEEEKEEQAGADKEDLEQYILWREIKKQVKILRKELGQDEHDDDDQDIIKDMSTISANDPQSGDCSCGDRSGGRAYRWVRAESGDFL